MKTMFGCAAAACCAVLTTSFVHATQRTAPARDAAVWLAGSSDGGSLPGLPGGKGGASGRPDTSYATEHAKSGASASLRNYCISLLHARSEASRRGFAPANCAGLFMTEAEPGQRGRGGDGGGLPGLPGGSGGESGSSASAAAAEAASDANEEALVAYCIGVLRSGVPPVDGAFMPSDCAAHFSALGGAAGRSNDRGARNGSGADGASIAGGVGGRGGRAGSGSGGGRGGAGGVGATGGVGGRGGAGGSTD